MSRDHPESEPDVLSERQALCLSLASEGLTSKEIAREIGISPSTVDNHLRIAAARIGVANRREAIRRFRLEHSSETLAAAEPAERADDGTTPAPTIRFLPPLGGAANNLPPGKRFWLVLRIALLATMALAAITTTISGIVLILSR